MAVLLLNSRWIDLVFIIMCSFLQCQADPGDIHLENLYCAFESQGRLTITFTKDPTETTCTFRVATRATDDGTPATSGSDYTPINKLVEFAPGSSSMSIDVEIADDNIQDEGIESFGLFLFTVIGCGLEDHNFAKVEIYDDDSTDPEVHFRLVSPDFHVLENKENVIIKVVRYRNLEDVVSVYIRTSNTGGATPLADYTPVAESRLTFDRGQQTQQLTINIANDDIVESSESFQVVLYNPSAGVLDDGHIVADVVIIDDDGSGEIPSLINFELGDLYVLESTPQVEVTILRRNNLLQTSNVLVSSQSAASDGATSSDYTAIGSKAIEFVGNASQYKLVVPIKDDSTEESKETFRLTLSQPINGVLGINTECDIHIIDDDCTFTLMYSQYEAMESEGNVRVTVIRSGFIQRGASVRIESSTIANEALQNDFGRVYQTLTFLSGSDSAIVDIFINNDEIVEESEDFQLSLSNPVNGSLGNPSVATVVILDDESTQGDSGSTDIFLIGAIIVGSLIGVVVLITCCVLVLCCLFRRSRHPDERLPYDNRAYPGNY